VDEKSTTIELGVEVDFEFLKGEPEVRYYPGKAGGLPNGDGHPGSPDSVEIEHVWLTKMLTNQAGKQVPMKVDLIDYLTSRQISELEDEILEYSQSSKEEDWSEPAPPDREEIDPGPYEYPEPQ